MSKVFHKFGTPIFTTQKRQWNEQNSGDSLTTLSDLVSYGIEPALAEKK